MWRRARTVLRNIFRQQNEQAVNTGRAATVKLILLITSLALLMPYGANAIRSLVRDAERYIHPRASGYFVLPPSVFNWSLAPACSAARRGVRTRKGGQAPEALPNS